MQQIHKEKGLWGGQLTIFDSLPSTNRWILDNAGKLTDGDVVRAISQTAGRGRFERPWFSPPGKCLTFSIAVIPRSVDTSFSPILCPSAALAVRGVLEEYGVSASLKWPNDVLVDGRKICGILAETAPPSSNTADNQKGPVGTAVLALGIGLNVNMTASHFSSHALDQPATSMFIETQRELTVETVFASLLSKLEKTLVRPDAGTISGSAIVEAWKPHDCLAGQRIEVSTHDGGIEGDYVGMDGEGRLCLTDDSGRHRVFWAGDVSVRRRK
jgi:BirA family biotin operon repressor/biotin-[acetyl-CoA-carboxylase] ligase